MAGNGVFRRESATADHELESALQSYVPDTEEEKKLVRKIDYVLLPCLWWMYILAYLDKGNIVSSTQRLPCRVEIKLIHRKGNANAAGMSEDLGLSDKGTHTPSPTSIAQAV